MKPEENINGVTNQNPQNINGDLSSTTVSSIPKIENIDTIEPINNGIAIETIPENNIMEQQPKPKEEGLFAHGFGIQIVLQGLMFGVLTLFAFRIGIGTTGKLAAGQTLAFMVLSLSQVIQTFNMRSGRSLFSIGIFSNHKLNWAALSSILLVCLVLFTPLSTIFGLVRLSTPHYIIGLAFIILPILIMELAKVFGLTLHHH